jgi:hypothetical protein
LFQVGQAQEWLVHSSLTCNAYKPQELMQLMQLVALLLAIKAIFAPRQPAALAW